MLFGLFAGVWVDEGKKLPILITANFLRAFFLALIPVSLWLGHLNFGLLYVVAFIVGVCMVFFDIAYQSFLPSLIETGRLIEGNSKLETSRSAAQIAGPGLAGFLAQTLTAPFSIMITSVTFLFSVFAMAGIRSNEIRDIDSDRKQTNMWRSLADAFRFIWNEPNILALTRCAMIWNLSWNIVFAVFVLPAVHNLQISSDKIGTVYSASGVGVLLGAMVARKINGRFGTGPTLVMAGFIAAAGGKSK
ncbi:MFS transporter [Gordoniibacillus kamchatkensis]|uniref:MFS transporter n=1 Tax=Gordoniibacillus kamchatkensis TaxID=1590651 RepID=UPI000698DCF0|nr:MFS transporter [Paenibacillus sp. VKM B-2647]